MSESTSTLLMIGISHHCASLQEREKVCLNREQTVRLSALLRQSQAWQEWGILCTCNRLEVYGIGNGRARETLLRHWANLCGEPLETLDRLVIELQAAEALQHLFSVAAGLDSQIIGETEVFGQIKDAYERAVNDGTVGPILHKAFQKAFQAGKWVRTNTRISHGQVSIGNIAVDLAARIFGDLKDCRLLLVGGGEVGESILKALKGRGASHICISSRTMERAQALAAVHEARSVPYTEWQSELRRCDIALFATSAPHLICLRPMVRAAMRERPDQPLFLIDVAVPRDVETAVQEEANVYLYNMDDLSRIANENMALRLADVEKGKTHLQEKADRLWHDLQPRFS